VRPALDFPFVLTAAPDGGVFETGHLWFLVCLLGFSLVLLPGFTWLRRPSGVRLLGRLGGLLARPDGLFLLALPIAAVEVALGGEVGQGGWNNGSYALLLAYGYLAAADPSIGEAFQRQWRPAAALGLLLFVTAGAALAAADAHTEPFTDMDPLSMGFRLLKSVDGWLWVVAVVGLARSQLERRRSSPAQPPPHRAGQVGLLRRMGAYANDAVLPFYVLHETVIVVVAYLVLAWPIGAGAQYCVIALVSWRRRCSCMTSVSAAARSPGSCSASSSSADQHRGPPPIRLTKAGRQRRWSTDRADKPVNVTCWHQAAYVSPEREPHSSPHTAPQCPGAIAGSRSLRSPRGASDYKTAANPGRSRLAWVAAPVQWPVAA
jgi:hypothetical protein